ncbi:bifunctional protein TrpGD [mine drainage metagenome]|uniref:Bifunctional protein TrpGD n=1 Tax=mine drainage metagenome TaxID=410659 RepID=A0A1J5SN53_9ZZZZ
MSTEHPFAPYIRLLGKGPRLSRPLTLEEARAATALILQGAVEPVQLGAFLCLMRVRTETPEEVAGFALAVQDALPLPAGLPRPDLDWPSYAGKSRRLPLYLLAALLLAENGVRILMHGAEGHTAGRLYAREGLEALGHAPAASLAEAGALLETRRFAYVPLALLHPRLQEILDLKALLGLRTPLHTVARNLNPFRAPAALMSVFHPNYRALHQEAARLMGQNAMACFKGEGGESERRPDKPCLVEGLAGGVPFSEDWPPLLAETAPPDEDLSPARLAALWRGGWSDPFAEAAVVATAALPLGLLGRAGSQAEALDLAQRWWENRKAAAG